MRKNKPEKAEKDLKIPISEAKKPEKDLKTPISEPKSAETPFKFTFKLSILSELFKQERISVAELGNLYITASRNGMEWVSPMLDVYDTLKINALQEAYRQLPEHPCQYPPYILYKEWVDEGSKGQKPGMTHEIWLRAGKKEFKTPFVFSMGFLQGIGFVYVAVYPDKDAYICYDHMNECWALSSYNGKRISGRHKIYREWVKLMESGVLPEIPYDYPYIGLYKAFIRREALPKGGNWDDVRKHAEATEPDFYKGYPDGSKAVDDPGRYEAFAIENLAPLLDKDFSEADVEQGTIPAEEPYFNLKMCGHGGTRNPDLYYVGEYSGENCYLGADISQDDWYLYNLQGTPLFTPKDSELGICMDKALSVLPEKPSSFSYLKLFKEWVSVGGSTPWAVYMHKAEQLNPLLFKGFPVFPFEDSSKKTPANETKKDVDPSCAIKSNILKHVSTRISEARKKKGMTQSDLAKVLETTQAYISKIENGGAEDLSLNSLYKLAMHFNEPLQYFTDEFPAPVGKNVWIMGNDNKFFHKHRIIGCSPEDTAYRYLFVVPVIITPYMVFESWGEETRSEVRLDYSNISCIPLSGLSMSKSNPGDYVLNVEIEIPVSIHTIGSGDPSLN